MSVDHLLRGAVQDPNVRNCFLEGGVTSKIVDENVKNVRKGKKVESKTSENTFDSLKRYAHNLTADAREGKCGFILVYIVSIHYI